ncbi:hypothetical protein ACIBI9_17305 [Nonomuraea sp. NPDC050451]|uniref:hypothetical protein n=1 Tax=Nonomuraea sp. NPDC050451 TaxID=3364364 RepID=UPI00379E0EB1
MRREHIRLKAESEGGELIVEPSEDALYEMIIELALPDNTFVIVEPDEGDPIWFASVACLENGTYEVEYRDPLRRYHRLETATDPSRIASDVTMWTAQASRAHAALSRDSSSGF